MKIGNSLIRISFCLAVILMIGTVALADTIRLKDGSVLRGKVISYNQRKFTLVVYIGGSQSQHVISVDEIESVEFDGVDAAARIETHGANPPASEIIAPKRRGLPQEAPPINEPADSIQTTLPAGTQPAGNEPVAPEPDTGVVATIAEKTVSVAAAADWTSTEIRLQRGQRVVISATGEVDLGDGSRSGPEGLQTQDNRKLIAARPTGALIAVVGDDNDDFIHIGRSSEFIARHNGILFLSINEGNLKDNAGAFVARVKVLSNR